MHESNQFRLPTAGDWLRKGPSIIKNVPEGFEDAADWQSFIQEFRSQLGSIMRQISKLMPEAALSAALARLQAAEEGSQTESNPSEVRRCACTCTMLSCRAGVCPAYLCRQTQHQDLRGYATLACTDEEAAADCNMDPG